MKIAEALMTNRIITDLNIGCTFFEQQFLASPFTIANNINDEDFILIAEALKENTTLTKLDAS